MPVDPAVTRPEGHRADRGPGALKPEDHTPGCPLCEGFQTDPFHQDRRRDFYRCRVCRLVFVPPGHYLSRAEEKAEYDRHQNRPDDPGYRQFLNRLFLPLQACLAPASRGLDFGSGPGPTLAVMLTEAGHEVALYDPFYAHRPAVLTRRYDFITASEVVEHLHHPGPELDRLYRLLRPGGLLGIMTKRVIDRERFARWHYINDPTHVCFFSRATFVWLAARWNARLDFVARDVIIIGKPSAAG
ncbi:MAG: class I SAM-dependent methyltransferase [Desulfosarcina sp.]|nr:class I SAM-dependent methyltransferase [Desulfobacterales bacterium]